MSDEIKVGRLARDMSGVEVRFERAEDQTTKLSFPVSSERPVERWFGTEILSHDPKAIRMDRMNAGAAPLLFNHDWNDPVGMVDRAYVKDGRLWVDAHFFETQRAKEVEQMVSGGMRNVSIGYELYQVTEDTKRNTYTATDWGVLEVSWATVPADPGVGLGRAQSDDAQPVRVVRQVSQPAAAPAASSERQTMTVETNAAAGANADQEVHTRAAAMPKQGPSAQDLERARVAGIKNLASACKIDDNIREHWIATGVSLEQVSDDIMNIQAQRNEANPKTPATKLGLSDAETKRFSLFRAIQATADKNWTNAGFELECSREVAKRLNKVPDPNKFYVPFEVQERSVNVPRGATFAAESARREHLGIQRRDLTVGTTTAGGFLVGTENMSFIEMLRNRAIAFRMGARRMSGLVGNVTVPRQTGAATAVWLANEASTLTESQQTFAQMALSPKTVGAYTEISRQLLLQSSPDAEGIVTSDLATVTTLAYDAGVISGSGASGQPTGITNTAGIGSVSGTGFIAAAFARVLEFQTDVAGSNVMPAAGGYVTTHALAASLIQAVKYTNTASPVWEGNVWDGAVQGFPAMATNQMAAASMLFGDWSQVVVGEWGVLEIEVNPYANFQAGIIGVRAIVSMDCGLRYAGAFSLATSIA